MHVHYTNFFWNKAKFQTNCIYFNGKSLNIIGRDIKWIYLKKNWLGSNFSHNFGIYDEFEYNYYENYLKESAVDLTYSHVESGGAIFSNGVETIIINSYFYNNSAFDGGGLFLHKNSETEIQTLIIFKSFFLSNKAGDTGGGICIDKTVITLNCIISNNYFFNNHATCNDNLFLFRLFYKVGGALSFNHQEKESKVSFFQNIFEKNSAFLGGVLITHQPIGILHSFQNFYVKNIAQNVNLNFVGSGAVFSIGGTKNTILISYHEIIYKNFASLSGF